MAKLTTQKARKEYICSKCQRTISQGETYKKITAMYSAPRIVCNDCKVPRSELTSSEYLAWLYDLQDTFEINDESDVESLKDELENQRDELQDRYDNIPESLQDGDAGTLLQERIDTLESAISDLEQIDFDEIDQDDDETDDENEGSAEEMLEEKLDEAREILGSLE